MPFHPPKVNNARRASRANNPHKALRAPDLNAFSQRLVGKQVNPPREVPPKFTGTNSLKLKTGALGGGGGPVSVPFTP